jgi:hypothetical protein
MEEAIVNAPTDTAAAAKVSAAFGKDWEQQHENLKQTIQDMQKATVNVKTTDPLFYDKQKGKPQRAAYETWSGRTKFGSLFYSDKDLDAEGSMVHELSHQVAETADDTIKSGDQYWFVNKKEKKNPPVVGDFTEDGGCKSFLGSIFLNTPFCSSDPFLDRYRYVCNRN